MKSSNASSVNIFVFQLLMLTVSSASIEISSAAIVQSSTNNLTSGLTLPPAVPIDPRWDAELAFQSQSPLDQYSLLAVATDTLGKLAQRDFHGRIGNFKSTPVAGYSTVSVQFKLVPPTRYVEIRVAVWAIYQLVVNIALSETYKQTGLRIYWNDVQVATLRILPTTSSESALKQRSNGLLPSTDDLPYLQSPSNTSIASTEAIFRAPNNTNTISLDDVQPACRYHENADNLTVSEILGAMMAGLEAVARVSKTDRMDGMFSTKTAEISSKAVFVGNDIDISHPNYEYWAVVVTLRAMPLWLLDHERLAEMLCYIVVDGQFVGTGFLEKPSRNT